MIIRPRNISALVFLTAVLWGCGPETSAERVYRGEPVSALQQAKDLLRHYAGGSPIASEAAMIPALIEDIRKTHPHEADILQKGWADLQKSQAAALKNKAKELLTKL